MKRSVQDIAHELGLSRNTVSKALNGKGGVSEKTRKLIFEKATEMNYRSFFLEYSNPTPSSSRGSIVLVTRNSVHSGFWLGVMNGLQSVLQENGYELVMGIMNNVTSNTAALPPQLFHPHVKGVILVEICNCKICEAITRLGLPTVTVDMPREYESLRESMDMVTMENRINVKRIVQQLIDQGKRHFAFAGELCGNTVGAGFQERFDALVETLHEAGLELDTERSFIQETEAQFMEPQHLVSRLKNMSVLPEVYICGNDWTAIQMINAMHYCSISIPDQVAIVGFDNITESATTIPPLTTIEIPREVLGAEAARCLLSRIENPNKPYLFLRCNTKLILRSSTGTAM